MNSTPVPAETGEATTESSSLPGIKGALSRPPTGSGLPHWGGPRPAPEPIDVAGPGHPGKLPTT